MKKSANLLINETSPYLLQHAHNPVQWHAWNKEALQKAKQFDKPILLSIGYSSCHWCHVMEHESFENEQTAALMNEYFICIKVDREERPDLDHIYMQAIQILTGSGGWPLNVFLTPDLKPFYGGTYFPPKPIHNRPSWNDVLWHIANAYKTKRDEVEQQANQLMEYINNDVVSVLKKKMVDVPNQNEENIFSENDFEKMFQAMQMQFDSMDGGFGAAPKFLGTMNMEWLLHHFHFAKNEKVLAHVELSLLKMLSGGIYDQIGGGISRYRTDAKWFAPHFEKMLYDNALLLKVMAQTYSITKNNFLKEKANQILIWLRREMQDLNGGFYSALDADSEGVEGKFYVWTYDELKSILSEEEFKTVEKIYNILPEGNWEHGFNILHTTSPQPYPKEREQIHLISQKLFSVREKRIRPQLDNKQLLAWNALLISGFSQCYKSFCDEKFKNAALQSLNFIEEKLFLGKNPAQLFHQCTLGKPQGAAFLDDYTYLIQAYLSAYETCFDEKYLHSAYSLSQFVISNFENENLTRALSKGEGEMTPFFYFTQKNQMDVISRTIELYDGAVPSPNSVLCRAFLKLSLIFEDEKLFLIAKNQLQEVKNAMVQHPTSFANWACAAYELKNGITEIICCGDDADKFTNEIQQHFLPTSILMQKKSSTTVDVLKEYSTEENQIFICRNKTCASPVKDVRNVLSHF